MNRDEIERIRRCYRENRRELYAFALAMTGEESAAEDVVHSVFCNILKRTGLPRELRPYLFRAIRNAAVDGHRRRRKSLAWLENAPAEAATDPHGALMLADALETLSDDERETIIAKVYGNLTLAEIAEIRGVSVNTVASWRRRGLEKLRAIFKEIPNG